MHPLGRSFRLRGNNITHTDIHTHTPACHKVLADHTFGQKTTLFNWCCYPVLLRLFQNAHAYVNAAFKMKVAEDGKQILGRPALVFGGIDDKLVNMYGLEST